MTTTPSPTITVLVIGPSNFLFKEVANDYRAFNKLVGDGHAEGSISTCPLPPSLARQGFYAYCDDEGMLKDTQRSNEFATHLGHWVLRGPILLFRSDPMGNEISLTAQDATFLSVYFSAAPTFEAEALTEQNRLWWETNPLGYQIQELT